MGWVGRAFPVHPLCAPDLHELYGLNTLRGGACCLHFSAKGMGL